MPNKHSESLIELFTAATADFRPVASNAYLVHIQQHLGDLENASAGDPPLQEYCERMAVAVRRTGFPLDPDAFAEFSQCFGEAHFYYLCSLRRVPLERVREQQNLKTPDFRSKAYPELAFEVKTLYVVNGGLGIQRAEESSLEANVAVEAQMRGGAQVAIGESEAQPFAEKVQRETQTLDVIRVLIDKATQNIKPGQFAGPATFLVLNLCVLSPSVTDARTLRPVYADGGEFAVVNTGEMWMVAFGAPGMLVYGTPEFEGKPGIEGTNERLGILVDPSFRAIRGILAMVYTLGGESEIIGLWRRDDSPTLVDQPGDWWEDLRRIARNNWNDDLDTNGWRLARSTM